jgi:hypothetical protein
MSTVRTLRKLTRMTSELEQLARAMGTLSETATPIVAKLAEQARQAPVKGRIERS